MTERAYTPPFPIARLSHCAVDQPVILIGETKPRILLQVDDQYGYFRDISIVSLSHPVNPALMEFREGGWRTKP